MSAQERNLAPASCSLLASFGRGAISSADGSTPMKRVSTASTEAEVGYELPPAGVMTGGWLLAITGRVDGGDTTATYWEVEAYVNGVATGIKWRLTGTTPTRTPGKYPLRPSDVITVVDSRSGAVNGQEGFADVWGRLECRPEQALI